MGVDYDKLLNSEAFKSIEPERREAFKRFAQNIEGKNFNEVMDEVIKFSRSMPNGHKITKNEKEAMINAMLISLPEDERNKFNTMLKMMEKMI